MKPPKRKKDWEGLRVVSLKKLRNSLAQIPDGTMFTVERNYAGLHLISDPCPHCGVRFFINKVPESDVRIISPEEEKELEELRK